MILRCWECDRVIVTFDTVNGGPGVAGVIRAGGVDRSLAPQTATTEMNCSCGAMYAVTVSRKPGKGKQWKDTTGS